MRFVFCFFCGIGTALSITVNASSKLNGWSETGLAFGIVLLHGLRILVSNAFDRLLLKLPENGKTSQMYSPVEVFGI